MKVLLNLPLSLYYLTQGTQETLFKLAIKTYFRLPYRTSCNKLYHLTDDKIVGTCLNSLIAHSLFRRTDRSSYSMRFCLLLKALDKHRTAMVVERLLNLLNFSVLYHKIK